MDFIEIIKASVQYGIFFVLFVWLFQDTNKKSALREEKLTKIIDKQNDILEKFSNNFCIDIVDRVTRLEDKVNK